MEIFYRVVSLLGGLALFLYGMRLMGDGLKSSSGGAMKAALAKVTNKPVMGFILGLLATCMIQSSTATIVLTVGLVGAGFLTFRQSIGIVLGANVGTAITAQILRLMDLQAGEGSILNLFKAENLAPIALIIGIISIMFIKKRSSSSVGTICMGFGILFVGLINMSAAVATMSDTLGKFIISFEDNYVFGFFAGVLVTGIIQSSSAVVGILQSLATAVGVKFCAVFAIIIGVNIGDCLTTYLVCRIGAKPEQIRTCLVHIIYNVFAALLIIAAIAIGRLTGLIPDSLWNHDMSMGDIANLHGIFRLVPAVLLLPFVNVFARIAEKIVPEKPMDEEEETIRENLKQLDLRLVTNPGLALAGTEVLLGNMADVAIHNFEAASQQLFDYQPERSRRIQDREDLLDTIMDQTNQYLVAISPHITLEKDNRNQSFQLKASVCFERIGDLAINIIENIEELRQQDKTFSRGAQKEIVIAMEAVHEILDISVEAYKNDDEELARKVEPLEEVIDEMVVALRGRHVHRMTLDLCDIYTGIVFQNILLNLERVSDQCSDLAVYLLGRTDETISGNEHQYIHNLHHDNDPEYMAQFRQWLDKYMTRLNQISLDGTEADDAQISIESMDTGGAPEPEQPADGEDPASGK
ncbi:MAG: Na/Pi cotransporter family protein [Firmicutes bacterium]|nr:Na/Pi cotransporter family protein [Bacillota bacterium]